MMLIWWELEHDCRRFGCGDKKGFSYIIEYKVVKIVEQ